MTDIATPLLSRAVSDEQLAAMPTEHLEREACSLAASIAAVTCRWLLVVGELDRREAWRDAGCRSMSQWLSSRCGVALPTARAHLDVARRLRELAAIRERFLAGTLSFSKVRALCRVASPDNEADLIALADAATASQLERMLRAYAEVVARLNPEDMVLRAHRRRSLSIGGPRPDGTVNIRIRTTPEVAARLRARLDADRRMVPPETVTDAFDPDAAARHDIFESLVEGREPNPVVVNLHAELSDLTLADAARPPVSTVTPPWLATQQPKPASDRGTGSADAADVPTASGAPTIPPAMAQLLQRIGCDARVRVAVDEGGATIDLGRISREPNRRLRRYVARRDRYHCRFVGCDHGAEHVHHIKAWIAGGATDRNNLVSLCRYHHRLVHAGGWWIAGDPEAPQGLRFHRPDGSTVDLDSSGIGIVSVPAIRRLVDDPDGLGCAPRHPGRLNLDAAVDVLIEVLGTGPSRRAA